MKQLIKPVLAGTLALMSAVAFAADSADQAQASADEAAKSADQAQQSANDAQEANQASPAKAAD